MNHTEDFKARNSVDITETKCKEFLDAKGITYLASCIQHKHKNIILFRIKH